MAENISNNSRWGNRSIKQQLRGCLNLCLVMSHTGVTQQGQGRRGGEPEEKVNGKSIDFAGWHFQSLLPRYPRCVIRNVRPSTRLIARLFSVLMKEERSARDWQGCAGSLGNRAGDMQIPINTFFVFFCSWGEILRSVCLETFQGNSNGWSLRLGRKIVRDSRVRPMPWSAIDCCLCVLFFSRC